MKINIDDDKNNILMINNLLKVVGVESSVGASSVPSSSHDSRANNATPVSYYSTETHENNTSLASTLGGIFNTFQETFQLDGKGVAVPGSGGGGASVGSGLGRSGRFKNAGGRGYYTEVTADRRRRETAAAAAAAMGVPQLLSGMGVGSVVGDSNNSQWGDLNSRSNTSTNHSAIIKSGVYQGRRIVSDIDHLFDAVDDKEANEDYDALMEVIANTANADASDRLSDCSGGSTHARRGTNSLEQKLKWVRLKEEEVVDRMLSQFPVSR